VVAVADVIGDFLSAAHCLAWEIVSFDAMHASKGNSDVFV
jgi:hypothetical protein